MEEEIGSTEVVTEEEITSHGFGYEWRSKEVFLEEVLGFRIENKANVV
jgi:hypothetical protein